MNIVWIETTPWPPSLGHGVVFHTGGYPRESSLFAFLDGYGWRKPDAAAAVILIKKPENDSEAAFLSNARREIEKAILSGRLAQGAIGEQVSAWFNA